MSSYRESALSRKHGFNLCSSLWYFFWLHLKICNIERSAMFALLKISIWLHVSRIFIKLSFFQAKNTWLPKLFLRVTISCWRYFEHKVQQNFKQPSFHSPSVSTWFLIIAAHISCDETEARCDEHERGSCFPEGHFSLYTIVFSWSVISNK